MAKTYTGRIKAPLINHNRNNVRKTWDTQIDKATVFILTAMDATGIKIRIQGSHPSPPQKKKILYALTLSNINRFPKLFHCQNQEKKCDNTIIKNPTTPVCSYENKT